MQKLCIMPDQMARLSCKSQLSSLIFHHAVAFLLLTHSHGGQSQATGQPQPIVAMVGDDITLPCHVKPATDAVHQMLEWSRPDLNPRFVHLRRFGEDQLVDQNPSYKGRTSASIDRLKQGDMSLTLSKVKLSDEGTYRCFSPGLETDSSVQLVVVPVSVTTIEITKVSSGVLQCESEGWYAEPEVLWLDGEGNLLSAGPPETVRGPDDLYNVSSRVTVEKRHSNSFTCRVQQKNINQTRETHIQVPDDFFNVQSSSVPVITGLAVSLAVWIIMFILLLLFVLWKWRQIRISYGNNKKCDETKRSCRDQTGKGEKKNGSEINKSEDQSDTEEREREQLMTHETVQMEVLEGNGKKKSKHFKKKRSEQQLQEEQQKEVQTLKEELQTKKNERETKGSELQQLHEEKKRNEKELQSLKEELEKKNKEVHVFIFISLLLIQNQ
ncbi:butyrophilin subfamily 1 member A1-like isoform X2 [Sebastes umbrosus]|uniref:butyrophilin subfamily 1 member A1-like isoform X2 n=1 Tax=Sebastes umbrosus TaxID=72105 RepID=UPI00189F8812|nr:butyrophilin subfamily 1 member A1-like isoform X2 [Sebastes umbrosus]